MNGYYVLANTKTGEFVTTVPPVNLSAQPRGSTAYPITQAEWDGLRKGLLTWDQATRATVPSETVVKLQNKHLMEERVYDFVPLNEDFLNQGSPPPQAIVDQLKAVTRQLNDLIRLVTGHLEEAD